MGGLIRRATDADIPAMVRMAGAFIAASGTGLPFDADYVAGSIRRHMVTPCTLALVLDVDGPHGMLCATVARSPLAPVTVADELAWWIDPAHRGRHALRMIDVYISWGVDMGCERVGMSALANTAVEKLYKRRGFEPAEAKYVKVF